MKVIIGTKIGMTQIIGEDGLVTPVTILQAGPITATQIKTVETDGYNAVQFGYGEGKNLSKSVTGASKGKGFAGTVKRWNFQESRNTHGFKGDIRKVGSIGSMYPQKVFKGKRMPGRMGHDQVTVKNLIVAYIDKENNLLGLKGAVPGPKKGIVTVEGDK